MSIVTHREREKACVYKTSVGTWNRGATCALSLDSFLKRLSNFRYGPDGYQRCRPSAVHPEALQRRPGESGTRGQLKGQPGSGFSERSVSCLLGGGVCLSPRASKLASETDSWPWSRMGSEEGGDGMANVDAAASWQQYYTWCAPYSHPHPHSHPHFTSHPHAHSHSHFHHPSHPSQYQTGQYQQQPLPASTANTSGHYSTSQQYHMQLQAGQTPPPHQQQQFHPVRGQNAPRRAAPYDRQGDPMITSSLKAKQGKDGLDEKKDADGELWGNVEAQAAFLGPNLWDKTLPYDADLKYVDLDEFLSENGIPVDGVAGGGQGTMQSGQLHKMNNTEAPGHQGPAGLHLEPITKRERSPSPSECCSPDTMNPPSPADSTLSMASSGRDFDPRTRAFSDEELKPQPMIKKSRKQFVPDDLKDDKYWARRRKNNMAAKRSRDARRMKENQIALRAGFLEKENMGLRQELDRLKNENMLLRDKLSKYTDV